MTNKKNILRGKDMNELNPCSKCNSKDVFIKIAFMTPLEYSAKCNHCAHEIGWYKSREEAVDVWNNKR